MPEASVTAVCRLHALLPDRGNGVTGIDKRVVTGPVRVHPMGLHGDVQVDRTWHGGRDQAVYVYADEDAAWFARDLHREIPPGLFGENLRTTGLDVSGAVIGERWRIGEKAVFEVTFHRVPCGTFARRMGVPGWVERFTEHGAPGAYLRVVRTGELARGDRVQVLSRPDHGVTIGGWFRHGSPDDATALLDAAAEGQFTAAPELVRMANQALRKASRAPVRTPATRSLTTVR